MKVCRTCQTPVSDDVLACNRCGGREFDEIRVQICPFCKHELAAEATVCPYCLHALNAQGARPRATLSPRRESFRPYVPRPRYSPSYPTAPQRPLPPESTAPAAHDEDVETILAIINEMTANGTLALGVPKPVDVPTEEVASEQAALTEEPISQPEPPKETSAVPSEPVKGQALDVEAATDVLTTPEALEAQPSSLEEQTPSSLEKQPAKEEFKHEPSPEPEKKETPHKEKKQTNKGSAAIGVILFLLSLLAAGTALLPFLTTSTGEVIRGIDLFFPVINDLLGTDFVDIYSTAILAAGLTSAETATANTLALVGVIIYIVIALFALITLFTFRNTVKRRVFSVVTNLLLFFAISFLTFSVVYVFGLMAIGKGLLTVLAITSLEVVISATTCIAIRKK